MEPITFEEYEAAYHRYVACLNETGVGITELGLDPEFQRFDYLIDGGDPDVVGDTIPDEVCYDREFADADRRWQYQQALPDEQARLDRALAFFAGRGVVDFPPEYVESGNLGGLIGHVMSVLGDDIAHEFSMNETAFEVRQRVLSLETASVPEPWERLETLTVRGLLAVGFATSGDHCLVVSSSGRSVIDTSTGEQISHEQDADLSNFLTESHLEAQGIGPLEGISVPLAGVWGGGLRTSTADGWWAFRCAPEWPSERLVLQEPDANIYNSFRGLTLLDAPLDEVRGFGFTPDGAALISATSSELHIWRRSS